MYTISLERLLRWSTFSIQLGKFYILSLSPNLQQHWSIKQHFPIWMLYQMHSIVSFKAFVQQPWFIKQLGWKIVMYIIHTFLLMACMQSGNVMIWKTISPFSLVLCRRQQRHHGQWGPWNCIRTFQWYPSWWLTVLVLCSVWIIFLKHGMSVVYNDLFTRSIVLDIRDMSIAFLLII